MAGNLCRDICYIKYQSGSNSQYQYNVCHRHASLAGIDTDAQFSEKKERDKASWDKINQITKK